MKSLYACLYVFFHYLMTLFDPSKENETHEDEDIDKLLNAFYESSWLEYFAVAMFLVLSFILGGTTADIVHAVVKSLVL